MPKTNKNWEPEPEKKFSKKFVGLATVITGSTKAKFTLTEEDKEFPWGGTELTVNLADLPKSPRLAQNDKTGKEYRIRVTEDKEVEAVMPVRGHFTGKLVDLGPRPEKDADPVPAPPFKPFDENDNHLEFFAVYEITSGLFKGVRLPAYRLHYKFRESEKNPGYATYNCSFDHPKATRARQLREWMLVHKLEDDMIPWDEDSILPTLLERALDNDVEVEINMAKGYILKEEGIVVSDGYAEANFESADDELDEVEEIVETPKVKRPAKEIVKELTNPEPDVDKVFPKKATKPIKKISKKSNEDDEDL